LKRKTKSSLELWSSSQEGKAHVALFEGTAGAHEEGALVLDIDGCGAKTATPLLADG
jgi:hypothetical protein